MRGHGVREYLPTWYFVTGHGPCVWHTRLPNLSASAPMRMLDLIFNPRDIRRRLGLNQREFRTRIGVTWSGGSSHNVVCGGIPL